MTSNLHLRIGGFVPFSTVDDPGHLAAVIFCQGCAWRCGYCHNPHLQVVRTTLPGQLRWNDIEAAFKDRRGLLDSVVFSGGEPLLQRALAQAMTSVRNLGFRTGLHTAGLSPRRLATVLPLADWIGFDIKAPFADYERITGWHHGQAARESLVCLLASGKPYEIRITTDESLLDGQDADQIGIDLAELGIKRVVLQRIRRGTSVAGIPPEFLARLAKNIEHIEVR